MSEKGVYAGATAEQKRYIDMLRAKHGIRLDVLVRGLLGRHVVAEFPEGQKIFADDIAEMQRKLNECSEAVA